MKKSYLLLFLLSFSVLLWSCGSDNSSDYDNNDNSSVTTTDDYDEDFYDNNCYDDDVVGDEYVFTGTYDSKTGVMTDISCYCFQVGYFSADNGEEFPICFPDGTDEASCSENLKIEGYFQLVEITPDNTSPCSAGEMEIFYVTSFECL